MRLQRREQSQPHRRTSPSRRGSSDTEHVSLTLAPGIDSLLEAGALLDNTAGAPDGALLEPTNVSTEQVTAGPQQPAAAAAAAPASQPGMAGGAGQQAQLSQGQAHLLAQVHMARNNRAAHAGSSAPAAIPGRPSHALQQPPGVGTSSPPSLPGSLLASQAAAGAASAGAQQLLAGQSAVLAPHSAPATGLQQAMLTPPQNGITPSSPRPRSQSRQSPVQHQQPPPRQGSSTRPAASAQPGAATSMQMAAINTRIMAEFQARPLGLPTSPRGPQQQLPQRPHLPQTGIRPDAATIAIAQNSANMAATQQAMAAFQAYNATQGRAALPAASNGAVSNHTQQQRVTLVVSSGQQGVSPRGPGNGQLPSSAPFGELVSGGPARFPAPFQQPAPRPSGPRPQHLAGASAAQPSARPLGSAAQPLQVYASASGPASAPLLQQHVPGMPLQPGLNASSAGAAARGQAYPMYMFVPEGSAPPSQQQGLPHGQRTAITAAHHPQSQPLQPGVAAQDVASGQGMQSGSAAGQRPTAPQVTGQKRAAGPISAQDVRAAQQPRTYTAQNAAPPLPQLASGQLTLPAVAQSSRPTTGITAPSAPSAANALQEALRVITTNLPFHLAPEAHAVQ